MIFVDTNVLVYASGCEIDAEAKTAMARSILANTPGLTASVQVANEFVATVTRRSRSHALSDAEAFALIEVWREQVDFQPFTMATHAQACRLRSICNYAFYDCAILAAAIQAGCDTVYSEDMQHDQGVDGVRIVNPFRKD